MKLEPIGAVIAVSSHTYTLWFINIVWQDSAYCRKEKAVLLFGWWHGGFVLEIFGKVFHWRVVR